MCCADIGMSFALLALASSPYPRNDVRLVSVSASGAETVTALDDGMLLLRDAVAWWEQEMLLRAERQAWKDRFLVEHSLVNRTRQITGSPSRQSVTWLHRHRGFAGGVVDRLVEAVMSAQEAAGWALAGLGPLQVRCIESVRYSSADDEVREDGDEGWHQDEYSVLTAVLTLALSHNLQGGETEVDRGGRPRRAEGMQPGDVLIFRSWDAHRSTPVAPGERHIIVLELWQGPQVGNDAPEGRQAVLEGGLARLCPPALAADASSAALLWFCSRAADEPAAWVREEAAQPSRNRLGAVSEPSQNRPVGAPHPRCGARRRQRLPVGAGRCRAGHPSYWMGCTSLSPL